MELKYKHFDFNEKEISEGKYSAWELIQPLWYSVSIYDGLDVYEQDLNHTRTTPVSSSVHP